MKFISIVFAILLIMTSSAYAAKTPKSIITDERVKELAYDPNQVFEVTANYGYQTAIEFAPDEQIKVVVIGDSIAWQTQNFENSLFIKPVENNAATNLTIVTNGNNGKRTYYFKLHSAAPTKAMTFAVRFVYPNQNHAVGMAGSTNAGSTHHANIIALDPLKLNFDYGVAGDKSTIPLSKVFDDGQFTYFLFEHNAEIPSFYVVQNDGTEALVNNRRDGQYMVVERTGSLFTLRSGTAHLCVKNNVSAVKADFNAQNGVAK